MSCLRADEIYSLLEGDLSPEARSEFESHLAVCPGCRRGVAERRAIDAAAAGLVPLDVPADFPQRVMSRIAAPRSSRRARLARLAYGVGLLAILAALTPLVLRDPLSRITSLGRALWAAVKNAAVFWARLIRLAALAGDILRPLLRTSGRALSALGELMSPGVEILLIGLSLVLITSLALGLRRLLSAGEQR
jgi:anti-sigma factor RsiW